jgi:hypothetical protein
MLRLSGELIKHLLGSAWKNIMACHHTRYLTVMLCLVLVLATLGLAAWTLTLRRVKRNATVLLLVLSGLLVRTQQ